MSKVYGVKIGRVPGVYDNWADCEAQVKGFKGASYKSFESEAEAQAFVGSELPEPALRFIAFSDKECTKEIDRLSTETESKHMLERSGRFVYEHMNDLHYVIGVPTRGKNAYGGEYLLYEPVWYLKACGNAERSPDAPKDWQAKMLGQGGLPSDEQIKNFEKIWNHEPVATVSSDVTDTEELRKKGLEAVDFLQNNGLILGSMADRVRKQVETSCDMKKANQASMKARDGKPYPSHVNIYVDGSYNDQTKEYGYGIYMDDGEKQRILYGRGACEAGGRNIEGEVQASRKALSYISAFPQYKSCTIYHDYQGIGSWADKEWSANKPYTTAYARFVNSVRENGLEIKFEHVNGHTGVEGNEYVDKLAKIGCGVPLTKSEKDFIDKLRDVPGYPKSMTLPEADKPNQYTLIGDYMPDLGE